MRTGVGSEDRATALPLVADDTTLKPSVQFSQVVSICRVYIPSLSLVGDGFLVCGVDDLEAKLSSKSAPSKLCVLGKHGPLKAGAKPPDLNSSSTSVMTSFHIPHYTTILLRARQRPNLSMVRKCTRCETTGLKVMSCDIAFIS